MLLSRNKDFLVFYRGKNFLSPDVAKALLEQERLAKALQDEEHARFRVLSLVSPVLKEPNELGNTPKENLDADSRWGKRLDDHDKAKVMREAELLRHANLVRNLEKKLDFLKKGPLRCNIMLFGLFAGPYEPQINAANTSKPAEK